MVNVAEAKKEVDEIEQYLVIKDEKDQQKRANLWKAWNEQVFDPIQVLESYIVKKTTSS